MPKSRRGVRVVVSRKSWDCGLAALAMLFGLSYGDVSVGVRALVKTPTNGLTMTDLERLAAHFGYRLTRVCRRKDYLQNQNGILGLMGDEFTMGGHYVVLAGGAIIDPKGGVVWGIEAYLKAHKARPCTLLVAA